MMKTIGATEAKAHLSELLDLAAIGERVMITRRGNPVAVLGPIDDESSLAPEAAVAKLRELRAGVVLGDIALVDVIQEGWH